MNNIINLIFNFIFFFIFIFKSKLIFDYLIYLFFFNNIFLNKIS